MPFEPPVSHTASTIAMRTISPNRKVMSTKYLPVSRSTIGPTMAASSAAAPTPTTRPTGQGSSSRIIVIVEPYAPIAAKAACPRLTWPVRMMRCREAAPIDVRQINTPTWWKNLSSVSQGQPKRAMAATTQM